MKKIVSILTAACFVLSSTATTVFALDLPGAEKPRASSETMGESESGGSSKASKQKTTVVSFKAGEATATIDNNNIDVEPAFVQDGVTLASIKILSDGFGADVSMSEDGQSVKISLGSKKISLSAQSTEVTVNSQKATLPVAPTVVNDTLMVPIRFVCENLDISVNFNAKTESLELTHTSKDGIKDYANILKKANKGSVGDSYYNWSLKIPKKLIIADRDFSGFSTLIASEDMKTRISVTVVEKGDNEDLDIIFYDLLHNGYGDKLVDYSKVDTSTEKYARVVRGDDASVSESRMYIGAKYDYRVTYSTRTKPAEYLDTSPESLVINGFSTAFANDDIVDLNDISKEDGMRTFGNKFLGVSIKLLPGYEANDSSTGVYVSKSSRGSLFSFMMDDFSFSDLFSRYMQSSRDLSITVKSANNISAEDWAKSRIENYTSLYSPSYFSVVSQGTADLGGLKGYKVVTKFNNNPDSPSFSASYYFVNQGYRYTVGYDWNEETFNYKEQLSQIEKMLSTIVFSKPDADELGNIKTVSDVKFKDDLKRNIRNAQYGWTGKVPYNWSVSNYGSHFSATSYAAGTGINFSIQKNTTAAESVESLQKFMASLAKDNQKYKPGTVEKVTVKGKEMYKVTIKPESSPFPSFTGRTSSVFYLYNTGKDVGVFMLTISERNINDKNQKDLDSVWDSIKFDAVK